MKKFKIISNIKSEGVFVSPFILPKKYNVLEDRHR